MHRREAPLSVSEIRAEIDHLFGLLHHAGPLVSGGRNRQELLDAYAKDLAGRHVGAKYVGDTLRYLQRAVPASVSIHDVRTLDLALSLSGFEGARARFEAQRALQAFFRWCVRLGELRTDPAAGLERVRRVAVRLMRRAMTQLEGARLTREGGEVPEVRALVYLVALTMGLRMGTIARLEIGDLDVGHAVVRYTTKRGRQKLKPVPRATLERLMRWIDSTRRARRRWPVSRRSRIFPAVPGARTFRLDLTRCEIPVETALGRLDRHSLRVTFCTWLAAQGDTLAVAQDLMDHSDPRLTASIYTRVPDEVRRRAVDRIGDGLSKIA